MAATGSVEDFAPTSGRIMGPLGLLTAAAIVVGGAVNLRDGFPLPVIAGALVFAVVVWAAVVRPRVQIREDHVVLRNMLETIRVPLAAIESVVVRQLFVVRTGRQRYVCPAVGRGLREVARGRRPEGGVSPGVMIGVLPTLPTMGANVDSEPGGGERGGRGVNYADYVEERVLSRRDEECTRLGVRIRSEQQESLAAGVRREPAWLEIGLIVVTVLAFVGSFFL